jgi:sensor histidine kinase YesM
VKTVIENKYENWLEQFMMGRNWRFVRHLLLLIPLLSYFLPASEEINNIVKNFFHIQDNWAFIAIVYKHQLFMFAFSVLLIYFNIYLLLPKLLFQGKLLYYVLSCVLIAFFYFLIEHYSSTFVYSNYLNKLPPGLIPQLTLRDFINVALIPLIFLSGTTGYKLLKRWITESRKASEIRNIQLKEELSQLKNQVNPHFLFNTLNNLHTLISTNPAKASQVVLGLSDVLRYHLYDSNREKIILGKDIEMMHHFLLLEKIRRENFTYEIISSAELLQLMVPPLLFINFIDNALKHGQDNSHPAYLKLEFKQQDNRLIFFAENSKPSLVIHQQNGGLGLRNIKRRLDLLYGTGFKLDIEDRPNCFTVKLNIPI